jgi:hypothetical protein
MKHDRNSTFPCHKRKKKDLKKQAPRPDSSKEFPVSIENDCFEPENLEKRRFEEGFISNNFNKKGRLKTRDNLAGHY